MIRRMRAGWFYKSRSDLHRLQSKSVDGRPPLKLSDTEKATGSSSEVDRYLRVFGTQAGCAAQFTSEVSAIVADCPHRGP